MHDVVSILVAALLGAAIPLLYWISECAFIHFLPADSRWRKHMPALKGRWLVLVAFMALVFAWAAFGQLHAFALQSAFVAWALGAGGLVVAAPWLIWRTRWLRLQQGRPLTVFGRLVMLLLLESLAATICTKNLRNWFPRSPAAHALQAAGAVSSTILLIVFIAMLPLAMFDLLSQRSRPER